MTDAKLLDAAQQVDLFGFPNLKRTRESCAFTGVLADVCVNNDEMRAVGLCLRHRYNLDDGETIRTTPIVGIGRCDAGHFIETGSGSRYLILSMKSGSVETELSKLGQKITDDHLRFTRNFWIEELAEEA